MTGAMYAGIAGLRTHMQDMNVIGNNIANVNTKGYKAGRSVFRSALYTQISGGREGTEVVGSKNPSQIGYGSTLASVDIDMSTASFSPGRPTDLMIDGDGFFLLGNKETANIINPNDPSTLKSFTLTRVGDVDFMSDGYLCNSQGDVVYGFLCVGTANGEPIFSDQLVPIRKPRQYTNGSGEVEIVWPQLRYVTDDGEMLEEDADGGDGTLRLVDTRFDESEDLEDGAVRTEYGIAKLSNIEIDSNGVIRATVTETGQQIVIGAIALGTVDNPNGVTQLSNTYYRCGSGAGNLAVNMIGGNSKSVYVTNSTQFVVKPWDDAATAAGKQQGIALPDTYGQNRNAQGIILGMKYINGSQANTGDGDGNGDELTLPEGSRVFDTSSATQLVVGGLEMSKTDLATEIANMITTQRGYQANTRIITVTDSMLEELVNMKR